MQSSDEFGEGRVLKPTKCMTNSKCIAAELSRKCDYSHSHIPLWGKRAKMAEIYPKKLCIAALKGLWRQLEQDHQLTKDGNLNVVVHEEDRIEEDRRDEFSMMTYPDSL